MSVGPPESREPICVISPVIKSPFNIYHTIAVKVNGADYFKVITSHTINHCTGIVNYGLNNNSLLTGSRKDEAGRTRWTRLN